MTLEEIRKALEKAVIWTDLKPPLLALVDYLEKHGEGGHIASIEYIEYMGDGVYPIGDDLQFPIETPRPPVDHDLMTDDGLPPDAKEEPPIDSED